MSFNRNSVDAPLALSEFLGNVNLTENKILQYHQKLAFDYITKTSNRGLLMFHGTGTGKTMLSMAIADSLKDLYQVIILSKKSLMSNFKKEIHKYAKAKSNKNAQVLIEDKYKFISSNASNMLSQLARIGKSRGELEFEKDLNNTPSIDLEGTLLIIEEAHNFFNGIVSGSKNATGLYRAIMKANNLRIIFLTATPIVNDPFELVPAFNMLHGDNLLPEDYDEFYNHFVDMKNLQVKNREYFKNRIFGLLSYVGNWWQTGGIVKKGEIIKRENFPDEYPTIVELVQMSAEQFMAYSHARGLESQVKSKKTTTKELMQKPKTDPGSTYRVASRQISNFLLPESIKVKNLHSTGFTKHLDRLTDTHLKNLDVYSPKMKKIMENMKKHEGLCVVYSSFVSGEGLKIFSLALSAEGWRPYSKYKPKKLHDKTFAFVTGDVKDEDRTEILRIFNEPSNRDGRYIDLLLLSGAGAEGLDLKNVMHIHLMEPYWNYGRIKQIIARAVRYRSHDDYPPEERKVQPYIYLSTYPEGYVHKGKNPKRPPEKTTDVHLYTKSIKTNVLNNRFYAAMVEASIDCSIYWDRAKPDIQKKINCLMCVPTGERLFHPDYITDLKTRNPCRRPEKKKIEVREILFNDKPYFFSKNDGRFTVYEYNKTIAAYKELDYNHPHLQEIIDYLISKNDLY